MDKTGAASVKPQHMRVGLAIYGSLDTLSGGYLVHHLRCSEVRPTWQNYFYRAIETAYLTTVNGFIYNSQTTRAAAEQLIGTRKLYVVAPASTLI